MLSDAGKLEAIMKFLRCKPAQLAARLNRSPTEISDVLSGSRRLSAGIMLDLHVTYGISLEYLRKGRGKMINTDRALLNEKENMIVEWGRRHPRNLKILAAIVNGLMELEKTAQKTRGKKRKSRR